MVDQSPARDIEVDTVVDVMSSKKKPNTDEDAEDLEKVNARKALI